MTATLGILMLDTRFPRPPGDMGHPDTFGFPALIRRVAGASAARVVRTDPEPLFAAFPAAARELVAEGADGITTTCGFLSLFQDRLRAALPVPVVASSLAQVAPVQALLPAGRRAGILTIAAESLTAAHLAAAGVPAGTPVGGVDPDSRFAQDILQDSYRSHTQVRQAEVRQAEVWQAEVRQAEVRQAEVRQAEVRQAEVWEAEIVAGARALQAARPDLGALILECTNMTPAAAAIRDATGLPVWTMPAFLSWVHAGLAPRRWPPGPAAL